LALRFSPRSPVQAGSPHHNPNARGTPDAASPVMNTDTSPEDDVNTDRARPLALAVLTLLAVAACGLVAYPFLPALAWALALAVIAYPVHTRLSRLIDNESVAAGVTTLVVVLGIAVPVVLVGMQLTREAVEARRQVEGLAQEGKLDEAVAKVPHGTEAVEWAKQNIDPEAEARAFAAGVRSRMSAFAGGILWFVVQALVAVFALFFALRDRARLLAGLRGVLPLDRTEADALFRRVDDAVHATVYGTIMAAVVQGVTGGLLFWALGIQAAVLWGAAMFVLGVLPFLGAFLVWVPAAVWLATADRWGAAFLLAGWGLLMAGPVCNWLYAHFAAGRMKIHPVPSLIAFVGGLAVFGVSGMVIGPVIVAVADGLIRVWRHRLGPADDAHAAPKLIVPQG
jgi:predicted PurR-regulated permease PerM